VVARKHIDSAHPPLLRGPSSRTVRRCSRLAGLVHAAKARAGPGWLGRTLPHLFIELSKQLVPPVYNELQKLAAHNLTQQEPEREPMPFGSGWRPQRTAVARSYCPSAVESASETGDDSRPGWSGDNRERC
jgi:hypothetical protein